MQSYYQASLNIEIDQPKLVGDVEADVCIIGGGYTGLSTALYLLKAVSYTHLTLPTSDLV